MFYIRTSLAVCGVSFAASKLIRKKGELVYGYGRNVTLALFNEVLREELSKIKGAVGAQRYDAGKYELAAKLFRELIEAEEFSYFLTLAAYPYLD